MAVIDPIYNGESGPSVRDKLNELIDTVNSGSTTINVGDAPLFDPNKAGGYEAGSIVSYRNEASPDPEFHVFAIYLALSDIVQGIGPEDSAEWSNQGASVEVAGGSTANGVVQNITRLRELTGMRTGHTVAVQAEGAIYVFDEGSQIGVKPFAPGIGSWHKRGFLSFSNVARIFTPHDSADGDEVSCPLLHTIINFAHDGNVTIADDNGNAALNIVFNGPCIVRRIAAPFVLSSFEITPLDGGGHTILDPAGDAMPTQPALQFGAGFTVTDEEGKTVVERDLIDFDDIAPDPAKGKKLAKVKDDGTGLDYTEYGYDEVVQKAQTFNEGTLKKFDINGNDVDSGLTGESLDIYAISPSLINALTDESNWRDGGGNQIVGGVAFASGIKGQRYYSDEFFYECIADNSWVRTYTGRPVVNIYDNSALTLVFKGYLEDALNWVGKIYVGTAITGVAQGTRHYDNDYVYEFFQTNVPIRYSRD